MKKAWLLAVGLALMLGLSTQPSQAAYAPVTGDIIKTATDSAIYYIGSDSKRHLYVNVVTFWTWYSGTWSNLMHNGAAKTIKTIAQADFDNIAVGSNATARPNINLIKFSNSPRIYNVVSNAKLALVPDDAAAKLIFGDDWKTKILTIQSGFETDYTKDGVLDVTARWQKFSSHSMYFELEYPDYWRSVVGNKPDTNLTYSLMLGPKSIPEDTLFNILLVDKIPSLGAVSGNANQTVIKIEDITFKTIAAKKVFLKNLTANKEWSEIYVTYQGVVLRIGQPTINNSDFPFDHKYNSVIEEILNSFKFLSVAQY